MIHPSVWNNRRYYRLENKNKRLLFSPSASTISHSRTVPFSLFSFCSQMDIGGKYTEHKVTVPCCAAGGIDNSERPPSRGLSSSHSLWWKPGCHISLIREARWKAASKKLRSTVNFVICLLVTCKISFATSHQTARISKLPWGVGEGRGVWGGERKSHQFTRLFYAALIPGVFIQPADFPSTLLQVVCPLLEIIKQRAHLSFKYLDTVLMMKVLKEITMGLTVWLINEESICQCRRHGFNPWSGKMPHALEPLSPRASAVESVL